VVEASADFVILSGAKNLSGFFSPLEIEERFLASLGMTVVLFFLRTCRIAFRYSTL
jgi:hypothetical protein